MALLFVGSPIALAVVVIVFKLPRLFELWPIALEVPMSQPV